MPSPTAVPGARRCQGKELDEQEAFAVTAPRDSRLVGSSVLPARWQHACSVQPVGLLPWSRCCTEVACPAPHVALQGRKPVGAARASPPRSPKHRPVSRASLSPTPSSDLAAAMANLATPHPVDPIADLNIIRAAATHTPQAVVLQVCFARVVRPATVQLVCLVPR